MQRIRRRASSLACENRLTIAGGDSLSRDQRAFRLRFGYLSHGLGNLFRTLLFQSEVGLGDDPDTAALAVHDRDSPDLPLLHRALDVLDILALPARNRIAADELADGGLPGIETVGDDRAAEVAVRNHPQQLVRVFV